MYNGIAPVQMPVDMPHTCASAREEGVRREVEGMGGGHVEVEGGGCVKGS